jgi:hypothetical protein
MEYEATYVAVGAHALPAIPPLRVADVLFVALAAPTFPRMCGGIYDRCSGGPPSDKLLMLSCSAIRKTVKISNARLSRDGDCDG